ncbi:glycoside hydrolase family 31 protein [Dentipellis sp. KUC8613]|nr:glycoside hydrolase family 31 protein [Dentipellis sp. KUC8613]
MRISTWTFAALVLAAAIVAAMLLSRFAIPFAAFSGIVATVRGSDKSPTNSSGIKFQNGFERVFIQPFGNHAFRVRASLMRDPTGNELSALLDPPIEGPGGKQGLTVDTHVPYGGSATIRNGGLIASLDAGVLSFYRLEANGSRTLLTAEYTDDKALPARYYTQEFRASSFAAQFAFTADPEEMFFGVGQQACCKDNTVNKKGQVVDLLNFNSQVPIPVFMSDKGYLMFFNYPGQGRMEFGQYKTRFVAEEATVIDYYITTAPVGDYDALQQQYTAVTGRQPTPPDFILGYQQSKLRYYNQSQVLDVAQRFHDENISLALLVVDFFAWKYQGDWSFDSSLWPDPAAMAAKVKQLTGAEMMVSLWPSVEDLSVNYQTLQENGWLASTRDGTGVVDSFGGVYTRLVDSTNPGAREFLWNRLNDSYFSKGIHNFWIDTDDGGSNGEPTVNGGSSVTGIPYARAFAEYFIGTQTAAGKMFPWLHQAAINEGLHNLTDTPADATECKYMSLTRSTFAGGQRYCSYMWSGDTESRFDVLLQQITAGVSVAASGMSAWTLDIGGFTGLNVESAYGRQLFVRWIGMGTFLPFMRVHGDRVCSLSGPGDIFAANPCPNEPWAYGDDNFPIIKKYIAERYKLKPYVKKLFQDLQSNGRSIMRPLYYDFSLSDPLVANATRANSPLVTHQFMLGPRILVSPVGVENATSKDVYLPHLNAEQLKQGWSWQHWWNETDYGKGGRTVHINAPLDQIPVFYLGSKDDILSGNI